MGLIARMNGSLVCRVSTAVGPDGAQEAAPKRPITTNTAFIAACMTFPPL
jgi:hypothetical protein